MSDPTDKASVAALRDLTAGNEFRESLVERADYMKDGAPVWHGWAIMDAFVAGAEYARALSPAQGDGMRDALVKIAAGKNDQEPPFHVMDRGEMQLIAREALSSHPDRQPGMMDEAETLCEDCPPVGYPTDETRCTPCPRRAAIKRASQRQ